MRNLDTINPEFLRPSKITGVSAFLLFIMGLLSIPLAFGVSPNAPLATNPLVILSWATVGVSLILGVVPPLFGWGWKAKYYGVSFLSFACVSFMAIMPCAAVVLYGRAPFWIKAIIILSYGGSHVWWCSKFVNIYKEVFRDDQLRATLYEEEPDAVYYVRRADEFILNKYCKFSQMPRDRHFLLFMGLAFAMIPFMRTVCMLVGAPFVHVFLLVAMLPVSWMSIGFSVRGFLVFYLYPARIKKATGKNVYVDLVSKHRSIGKRRRASPCRAPRET